MGQVTLISVKRSKNARSFVTANNNVMSDIGRHYVDIFVSAHVLGDPAPKIMEPLKCECWEWVTQEQLLDNDGPYRPLFLPLAKMIEEHDLASLFA
ncbi:Nudix hydrolase 15, mitochondrial [Mortierella sp. NVP85]|nr:Nudix hydrolase 15, mitochondrial [Mortierella sp. NVP85]